MCSIVYFWDNSDKVVLMGDSYCKEVEWENWTTMGGDTSWGNALLELAVKKLLTHWVREETRFRGTEMPGVVNMCYVTIGKSGSCIDRI